jgi:hypothetical protein
VLMIEAALSGRPFLQSYSFQRGATEGRPYRSSE